MNEEKLSEYDKFFLNTLKKFKVKSPNELNDDQKREFFNYIDDNWESKREKAGLDESKVNIYRGFIRNL
jgi:hypothetical protein